MDWIPVVFLAFALGPLEIDSSFKLTLLHTNDMHARFEETNRNTGPCKDLVTHKGCYGGFARLKHAVLDARNRAKSEGRNSLFLNAGDNFQGTAFYSLFKWNITADLLNRLDVDAMSLGNHEFDDGVAGLAPFLQKSKVPVVTANVVTNLEGSLQSNGALIHKSLKIKFNGKDQTTTTVCIIGYLTPETKFLSSIGRVVIRPEIEAIKEEIKRLKESSEPQDKCHVIIGLGHSGFEVDKQIAAAVPEIDLIVGGHTDTFLFSGNAPDIEKPEGKYPYMVTQSSGKKVPVVQAYGYTKYLGELLLDWDDNWNLSQAVGNPLLLDEKIMQDGPMEEAVKSWESKIGDDSLSSVVGYTTARLEGSALLCSCAECNLGNLIADSFVEYYATTYRDTGFVGWTEAPISIIQAGSIRATIDGFYSGGNITYGDVLTVMPFRNKLLKTTITGANLRKVLEFSASWLDPACSNKHTKGQFLQVSGIHVSYDMSKPKDSRIVDVKVRCDKCLVPKYSPLNDGESYGIIISEYLFNGGDNFQFDQKAPKKVLELTDTEALMDYLRRKSPVYPEVGSRITVLNKAQPSSSSLVVLNLVLLLTTLFSSLFVK